MSGLSTKDVNTGGGLPKTIEPGVQVLKINGIKLEQFPFMEADAGYYLMLDVETKAIAGFEGFFIDKDDESKGRYDGQIGQIKTNRYYYKDGETKSGIPVHRDLEILKQLKNICLASDNMVWFDQADGKFETIEEFIEAFNEADLLKDKFFNFCVAGKEFERKNGYIGFDLYYPKLKRGLVAFEAPDAKPSKLIAYNEVDHLTKLAPKETEGFENDIPGADAGDGGTEIGTPPDFEL